MFNRKIFGGEYCKGDVDGWRVTWEATTVAQRDYRLWCFQSQGAPKKVLCVVAFNPGSLSGKGERLSSDSTLRNIRHSVPKGTATLVLNLFPIATTKPPEVFEKKRWDFRDCSGFDLNRLQKASCNALIFAYGDIGQCATYGPMFGDLIRERIKFMRDVLLEWPEIRIPNTKSGNPSHPMNWYRNHHMETVKSNIIQGLR